MASAVTSWPDNTPRGWHVDTGCIDCGCCRVVAPGTFGEADDHAFVREQPADPAQFLRAGMALVACPVQAIHGEGADLRAATGLSGSGGAGRVRLRFRLGSDVRRVVLVGAASGRQRAGRCTAPGAGAPDDGGRDGSDVALGVSLSHPRCGRDAVRRPGRGAPPAPLRGPRHPDRRSSAREAAPGGTGDWRALGAGTHEDETRTPRGRPARRGRPERHNASNGT
jgi:ferredoxin